MSRATRKRIEELDALANLEDRITGSYDFSAEDLYLYAQGKASPSLIRMIEAERALDAELDNEIRYLQATAATPPVPRQAAPANVRSWQWATGSFGLATCALALMFLLSSRPKLNTVASLGEGSVVSTETGLFAMFPLSTESIAALTSGSFPASAAWNDVAPPAGVKSLNDMGVVSPRDTTILGTTYRLSWTATGLTDITLTVTTDGTPRVTKLTESPAAVSLPGPGVHRLELRAVAPDGQAVRSQFTLRVMTPEEQAVYEAALAAATNPIDRLAVYAKYGFQEEFVRLRAQLGEAAPNVAPTESPLDNLRQ